MELDLLEDLFYLGHQRKEVGFEEILELLMAVQKHVNEVASTHGEKIPRVHLVAKNRLAFIGPVMPPNRRVFEESFPVLVRRLQWAAAVVRNISDGFTTFRCMLRKEFEAIRSRFGTASGVQSPGFHEIGLRLGLVHRNIHKFRWELPDLAECKIGLTAAELELIGNHPTSKERPKQLFAADCPDDEARLMQCLLEPNLRDDVYWLEFDQGSRSPGYRRYLSACAKLDRDWRTLNEVHQKLAGHFVKGSGTAAGRGFLSLANDPGDLARLWAFPCLLYLHPNRTLVQT